MKLDLATSVIVAIIGVVIAFFVTNLIMPGLEEVKFNTISGNSSYSLTDPSPEVFNYRALNPTVEVYVGQETTSVEVEE